MARLLGFIGNRPDLGARGIAVDASAFEVRGADRSNAERATGQSSERASEGALGWGVGFYQGGEILLKRRPVDDRKRIDFSEIVKDIKADVLVGHIRNATVGALKTENTHPFRYRQWLFAQTGTVEKIDVLRGRLRDSLPQFLARDVRGDTDAELVFYLFLSFLHDGGVLDRSVVDAGEARSALRSSIALLDRLSAEEGESPAPLNIVLACGEYVIGARRGPNMVHQFMHGKAALERLFGSEGLNRMKVNHLAECRLSMVASDFDDRVPSGWTELATKTMVTLSRTDEPALEPL